jgi:hypothetical protein
MTVRTCDGCPHLRTEARTSIFPVGGALDHYCCHPRVVERWTGFVAVRPEWCPKDHEEEDER